jgi:glycine hydroxymethyltransferase
MVNLTTRFFSSTVQEADPVIAELMQNELHRQQTQINLIASENLVSKAVLDSLANVSTNKYAEGYPGKRYYAGCKYVDEIETLAIERAKQIFNCSFANVQPHSGSQANQAVFLAALKPGDTILGMGLSAGGHLTHGAGPNLSGKWFKAVHYGVDPESGLLDYNLIEDLAKEHKPKLLIAGASAYSRQIDFKIMKEIAQSVGALLMADIAHYAGLIVGDQYKSPFPYADFVTTTTHKTLRGPRGGMILSNDPDHAKKINSAIFPGLQGGPIMNLITAKAVAFAEALHPDFKVYAKSILENARALSAAIAERGYKIVTGGTDSHMLLVDLTDKAITGQEAEAFLVGAGIVCNKNTVPNETRSAIVTSGIRLGTPTGTTRGFGVAEFKKIGNLICDILDEAKSGAQALEKAQSQALKSIQTLCESFSIYNL